MAGRKSSSKRSSRSSTPGTPSVGATTLSTGTRRKGRDGRMYRVEVNAAGRRYWKRCTQGLCKPVGPQRRPVGFMTPK